jgi:acetyl-CoA carboxylase biotin carboxyl carrier protein
MSDLEQLLREWLVGTGIGLLELRTPEHTIILRSAEPAAIRAPSLGVFLHGHPSTEGLLARAGQTVRKGDAVGLLRIGALLLPVLAPHDGVIVDHLAEDGVIVGYGAPLLRLQPHEGS